MLDEVPGKSYSTEPPEADACPRLSSIASQQHEPVRLANTSTRAHYLSLLKANAIAMKIHGNLIFQDKILVFEDKLGLGTEVSHTVNIAYFPRSFTMLYE